MLRCRLILLRTRDENLLSDGMPDSRPSQKSEGMGSHYALPARSKALATDFHIQTLHPMTMGIGHPPLHRYFLIELFLPSH